MVPQTFLTLLTFHVQGVLLGFVSAKFVPLNLRVKDILFQNKASVFHNPPTSGTPKEHPCLQHVLNVLTIFAVIHCHPTLPLKITYTYF